MTACLTWAACRSGPKSAEGDAILGSTKDSHTQQLSLQNPLWLPPSRPLCALCFRSLPAVWKVATASFATENADFAMTQEGATLQNYNNELVSCIEEVR